VKLVYFFLFLFFSVQVFSQKQWFSGAKAPLSVSILPKTGFLIAHRPYMSHLVKDRSNAFELEFCQQDNRRNFTTTAYRFPSRGFSLQYQDYGYKDVLGSSYSLLQFTKFNLIQKPKFGFLDFRIGAGVAYVTEKYDALSNPKNNAIGSHWNSFVNFQFVYTKYWNHFLLGAGIELSHYSNCSVKAPNLGLNTPMCFAKIGYAFHEREVYTPDTNAVIAILPRPGNRFQFHVVSSVKQNLPGYNASKYLPVIAFQALYRKRLSFKWDLEAGVDVIYNQANRVKYDDQSFTFGETIQAGIYLGAAANYYKSQIYFGLAAYFYNKINPAGWVYNRIGYRYNFNAHWNAMIGIKANIGVADYLEMGIGWRF
jgi:hypothetical protein